MNMGKYVIRRVISMMITLFFIITLTFTMMNNDSGRTFHKRKKLPPEIEKAMMEKYNLDQPLSKQYVDYLLGAVKGDFGSSKSKRSQRILRDRE